MSDYYRVDVKPIVLVGDMPPTYRVLLYANSDYDAIRRAEMVVYSYLIPDHESTGLIVKAIEFQRLESANTFDADIIVLKQKE